MDESETVLFVLLVALLLQRTQPSFEIVPGDHFGPIRESTTRSQLTASFGADAIVDRKIDIGEGFCTSGTRVYGGTPNEIDIAWQDKENTRVGFVRTMTMGGEWHTTRGVRMGSLLTELERLAGTVLSFGGFGWDYGGGLHWKEGAGEIGLRLSADSEENRADQVALQSDEIYGDHLVKSDHPMIRRLKIRVDAIDQSWGAHYDEFDCSQLR